MRKLFDFFTYKKMMILAIIVSLLVLMPLLYLSSVDRASGDDYNYGAYVKLAWESSHSVFAVLKASWSKICESYYEWQGTWFSIFLFSIQPEAFSDKGYFIVPFFTLGLWFFSTWYLAKWILGEYFGYSVAEYSLISILFWIISVEFIPYTTSSVFWWNGCAHYSIPLDLVLIGIALTIKYLRDYGIGTLAAVSIISALIGGSNYQAALLMLLSLLGLIIYRYMICKSKKTFLLLIPFSLEMIGLIISIKAPGNAVRAGRQLNFDFQNVVFTICESYKKEFFDITATIVEKPLLAILLVSIFILLCDLFMNCKKRVSCAPLVVFVLISIASAMQAPEIFAGVDVSGGVPNTDFQVTLWAVLGIEIVVAAIVSKTIRIHHREYLLILAVLLLVGLFVFRNNIKETTTYLCYDYISSGQAADYKEQMELQTELMNSGNRNLIVPQINDYQGPLMHMPITDDSTKWTNTVTAKFYGIDSVIAIPRPEWESLQQN